MNDRQIDWTFAITAAVLVAILLMHAPRGGSSPADNVARWNNWIEHCVKTDSVCRANLEDLR